MTPHVSRSQQVAMAKAELEKVRTRTALTQKCVDAASAPVPESWKGTAAEIGHWLGSLVLVQRLQLESALAEGSDTIAQLEEFIRVNESGILQANMLPPKVVR